MNRSEDFEEARGFWLQNKEVFGSEQGGIIFALELTSRRKCVLGGLSPEKNLCRIL